MINLRRNTVVEAAAIAGPLAAFIAARVILAPGPAATRAQPVASAGSIESAPAATPQLSPEQEKALAWIKQSAGGELRSPMAHPAVGVRMAEPAPAEPDGPAQASAGLRLVGVLGNDENGIAAIGGKVYRIGDQVRPGVKLKAVDARAGTADLELPDGSVARLTREVR